MLWGSWASLSAYNCAFLGWQALNGGGGSNTAFFNCVAYDTSTYAGEPFVWNLPPGSVVEYCASEGSVPPEAAHHIILSSNPFVNYNRTTNYVSGLTDLHLPGGSPLIDAGEPAYLDLNGTRADIGIYGGLAPFVDHGVPAYPFVSALSVPSAVSVGTPIPITATGRIGRAY